MAFEGIMLSEMNQTNGDTSWNHLYVGSINTKLNPYKQQKVASRGCKVGKYGKVGKRVQASNYKMKKTRGLNIKDGDYSWSCCIA